MKLFFGRLGGMLMVRLGGRFFHSCREVKVLVDGNLLGRKRHRRKLTIFFINQKTLIEVNQWRVSPTKLRTQTNYTTVELFPGRNKSQSRKNAKARDLYRQRNCNRRPFYSRCSRRVSPLLFPPISQLRSGGLFVRQPKHVIKRHHNGK